MTVESHFENHKSVIETELMQAQKSVWIAVAWINFQEYYDIFKKILSNSVELKIICTDNWQNRSHQTIVDDLENLGAKVTWLKMPISTNHMHHKFAIVDNKTILNGSFNWSPNATSSFENIIVIKDFLSEVTKFISEFQKLWKIDKDAIKKLQTNKKCLKCLEKKHKGELFTILVFSEKATKYSEVYGDIIEICNNCEYQKTLKECIPDGRIEHLLTAYVDAPDDYEIELIERSINSVLDSYTNNEITIHAIGRVNSGLRYDGEDFTETIVIWKNKFVGNRLPNKFDDTTFGVVYDNEQEL